MRAVTVEVECALFVEFIVGVCSIPVVSFSTVLGRVALDGS